MVRSRRAVRFTGLLLAAYVAGYVAGIGTGMWMLAEMRDDSDEATAISEFDTTGADASAANREPTDPSASALADPRATVRAPGPRIGAPKPAILGMPEALADLRRRKLLLPVRGVRPAELRDSFGETRERTREHEALDILAPRSTPVLAVESGTVARLFTSVRGGLTIYQFDPSRTYAYYYAHLDRYAPGLEEGDRVHRGQTIGFVGTTGNAPENTPHLHFAIFLLTEEKRWWQGTPINAYDVWVPPPTQG
jgi:murein DD-endopeptidase MepM/ murein hydrolase activator NlpD